MRENLLFSMNMQAPKDMSLPQKLERVEQVIRETGLQEQADLVVGSGIGLGLSGGQVCLPPLLVVDVCTCLKNMCLFVHKESLAMRHCLVFEFSYFVCTFNFHHLLDYYYYIIKYHTYIATMLFVCTTSSCVTTNVFLQRKRLTIAVQLLSMPNIIFLDEPTSGMTQQYKLLRR